MSFLPQPSQISTAMYSPDALLRTIWATLIVVIVLASLPAPGVGPLSRVLDAASRRGKTGLSSGFTVPQRYFLHFYIVGVAWTTCLLASIWFYACGRTTPVPLQGMAFSEVAGHLTGGSRADLVSAEHRKRVWISVLLLLLMEFQVVRRLYETLYVFKYASSARMHLLGYLTGLYFYVAAPLSLCSSFAPEVLNYITSQVAEYILKGQEGISVMRNYWWGCVEPLTQLGWCQWIGVSIFSWGWINQLHCHLILGSLRQPGTNLYVIPHGGWFEFVSCPHYLAEIVVYGGVLLVSGGFDVTVWLAFLFVASNLIFAAAQTHAWYHQKFENYPSSRRAILPMIY